MAEIDGRLAEIQAELDSGLRSEPRGPEPPRPGLLGGESTGAESPRPGLLGGESTGAESPRHVSAASPRVRTPRSGPLAELLERHPAGRRPGEVAGSPAGLSTGAALSAGPLHARAEVQALAERLRALPGVREVTLRGYEGSDRAVFDLHFDRERP